jgi:hypothetical protein
MVRNLLVFLVIKEALESPMELLLDNNAKRLNYKNYLLIKTRLVLKQGGFFVYYFH